MVSTQALHLDMCVAEEQPYLLLVSPTADSSSHTMMRMLIIEGVKGGGGSTCPADSIAVLLYQLLIQASAEESIPSPHTLITITTTVITTLPVIISITLVVLFIRWVIECDVSNKDEAHITSYSPRPIHTIAQSRSPHLRLPYGWKRLASVLVLDYAGSLERDDGYGIMTLGMRCGGHAGAPADCGSTAGSDYRATGSGPQETSGDYKDVGSRPQEIGAVHRGTKTAEETLNTDDRKMAPKRATRSNLALETTNTTSVTNAQLQVMINQGIITALAARDADRNTNGDDSHISGVGVRRTKRTARECTYTDFIKCQPLNFKGTEGVAG
ncbi:hypothetical protein Tco_1047169 [Tanacetum coccineum]